MSIDLLEYFWTHQHIVVSTTACLEIYQSWVVSCVTKEQESSDTEEKEK